MKINQGSDLLAEKLYDNITVGQIGSGSTTPTANDTGLETAIVSSDLTLVKVLTGNAVINTYTSDPSLTGTVSEYITTISGSAISHDVFTNIIMDANKELIIEETFFIN